MMSQQPGKKEGVHMVQKIGTKKKTMRNSNGRVALAKKAKRSRMERRRRSTSRSAGRDGGRPNDAGDCAGDGAVSPLDLAARIVWFLAVNHSVFVYCYSLSTLLTNERFADERKMEQKNVLKNNE
jgi:hypothetical protein